MGETKIRSITIQGYVLRVSDVTDKIMDIVRTCGGFPVCDETHTDWKTLHRYARLELRCTDNQFENIKMKIDRLWYHNIEIKTY